MADPAKSAASDADELEPKARPVEARSFLLAEFQLNSYLPQLYPTRPLPPRTQFWDDISREDGSRVGGGR